MRPTASQYAAALEELSQASGADTKEVTKNFLGFLKQRREMKKLASIVHHLERRAKEKSGELLVTAVTAHPASSEAKTFLRSLAEQVFPKQKIVLDYETDPNVIGGALLKTDEALYDTSVASRAKALKQVLRKS